MRAVVDFEYQKVSFGILLRKVAKAGKKRGLNFNAAVAVSLGGIVQIKSAAMSSPRVFDSLPGQSDSV